MTFVQAMGPSVLPNAKGPWQGGELVAVRLHVPAKIQFHNAPSKQVERGSIVSWEQPLKDRLAGQPLRVDADGAQLDPRLDADDLRRVSSSCS